jgi:hypothetical protein
VKSAGDLRQVPNSFALGNRWRFRSLPGMCNPSNFQIFAAYETGWRFYLKKAALSIALRISCRDSSTDFPLGRGVLSIRMMNS